MKKVIRNSIGIPVILMALLVSSSGAALAKGSSGHTYRVHMSMNGPHRPVKLTLCRGICYQYASYQNIPDTYRGDMHFKRLKLKTEPEVDSEKIFKGDFYRLEIKDSILRIKIGISVPHKVLANGETRFGFYYPEKDGLYLEGRGGNWETISRDAFD